MAYYSTCGIPKPVTRKRKRRKGFDTPAGPYCQYCGATGVRIERHHIRLKGMGGSRDDKIHSDDNRIDLCVFCHGRAHLGKISREELLSAKQEDREWGERVKV